MAKSSSNSRGFVRHGEIADRIRRMIASGRYTPGSRLPANIEMQQLFGTTPVTIHRALHHLHDEGFVRIKPQSGTHVTDRPPCFWHYALLFPDYPPTGNPDSWSRFYKSLTEIAEKVNKLGPRQIKIYRGVDGHADSEGYQRLLDDMASHRLAGLMFPFAPFELIGTPVLEMPNIPRVGRSWRNGEFPQVWGGWPEPVRTALKWIAAQGRRKISVITLPHTRQDWLRNELGRSGLINLPFWVQAVDAHFTGWVRHAVYGILHSQPGIVPDAMLVTDDHLIEAVADALIEFGVRVPQDMLVVGHWNIPNRFHRELPVQLIGIDNVDLLRQWIMNIDSQRRGEKKMPTESNIDPVFASRGPFRRAVEIQQLPPPPLPVVVRPARVSTAKIFKSR